ncbi:hypothetical protein PGO_083370 [Plasmodium gonderi]|uniref:Uncharacterized protein n=1 Tax=Plasmodium gonderi TaxID=77519 RepID=A0A1Y1JE18_PLAGO|nr:hypothetical protein PGO_083370 [Plasmodium gonderi]GAW80771.1 hypothetical protein PGO_083370 [Plasmodium gonderi]
MCRDSTDGSFIESRDKNDFYNMDSFNNSYELGDSELETVSSNLSSPSTEESPDSPYKTESSCDTGISACEKGYVSIYDGDITNQSTFVHDFHLDNSDRFTTTESKKDTKALVSPPSISSKKNLTLLRKKKGEYKKDEQKKNTFRKSLDLLRCFEHLGVSYIDKDSDDSYYQNECDEIPSVEDQIVDKSLLEKNTPIEDEKMEEMKKYVVKGIFSMTDEDVKNITKPNKMNSLESLFDVGKNIEEENDDSIEKIYNSCVEELMDQTKECIYGETEDKGNIFDTSEGLDVINYEGDNVNTKEKELQRLKSIFCLYKKKKEEKKKKRLLRTSSFAYHNKNGSKSEPIVSKDGNYSKMENMIIGQKKIFDNTSLQSLPIQFIDQGNP